MVESKSELAAPKHLRRATREFYARMQATYSMEEHQLRTLLLGCEAFDRCVEAREELGEGWHLPDGQVRPDGHPPRGQGGRASPPRVAPLHSRAWFAR